MLNKIGIILLPVLFTIQVVNAQYLNKLYDYDSTSDWGYDIFVQPDSSYFILGSSLNIYTGEWANTLIIISADGKSVANKHYLSVSDSASFYEGNSGNVKQLPGNRGYLIPLSKQMLLPTGVEGSAAGLQRIDKFGDTLFSKLYNDINVSTDAYVDCAISSDAKYLLVGQRADTVSTAPYAVLLTKADTNGNLLWQKTYRKNPGDYAIATSIDVLGDGRILIGAYIQTLVWHSSSNYYNKHAPWYILLDTAGNIIKDMYWNSGYNGNKQCCSIFKDLNGGYYTWGAYDSLLSPNASDGDNFPNYIAHLDTDFNITWIRDFPFTKKIEHKDIWKVMQLNDGGYLAAGDQSDTIGLSSISNDFTKGWAARLDKNGDVLWDKEYICDIKHNAYLVDAKERPDHSIILVGVAVNDSLPAWHQQDVWLVGIDSNGCEVPGCTLAVPTLPYLKGKEMRVYPNPFNEEVVIEHSDNSNIVITDVRGKEIYHTIIQGDKQTINLPDIAAGMYFVSVINNITKERSAFKLLKE